MFSNKETEPRNASVSTRELSRQFARIESATNDYANVYTRLSGEFGEIEGTLDFALVLDKRDPQEFLGAHRQLMELKRRGDLSSQERQWLNEVCLYDRKVTSFWSGLVVKGSLSLKEIEELPLPLSGEDKNRILGYFWNLSSSRDPHLRQINFFLGFFLIQSQLFNKEMQIDVSLDKLYRRLAPFFDSLAEFLIEFPPTEESEKAFIQLASSARLSPILGAYLVTKHGLSPASLIKLFLERKRELKPQGGILGWSRRVLFEKSFEAFIKALQETGKMRYEKENGYPPYNPKTDEQIERLLFQHYQPEARTAEEEMETAARLEESLRRLDLYRSKITEKERKKLELEKVKFFFKKNGIFVIRLCFENEEQPSLLIEVDKKNRIFGLPPGLSTDYPHFKDTLLVDILPPILEQLKERFPKIERPLVAERPPALQPQRPIFPSPVSSEIKREKRESRPARRPTPFQVLTKRGIPSIPLESAGHQRRVFGYSRRQVEEQLGTKDPRAVNRVMNTIKRFEEGAGEIGKLVEGHNLYRLRAGRVRIILEFLGENKYRILLIGRRDTVYLGLPRQDS